MKTTIISKLAIMAAFIISTSWGYGQTNQNHSTSENVIRLKMVKNINGVETTIDTTLSFEGLEGFNVPELPNMNIDIHLDSMMKDLEIQMIDLEKKMGNMEFELKELESLHELKNLSVLKELENIDWKGFKDIPEMKFNILIDSVLASMDKHLVFKTIDIRGGVNMNDSNMTIMVLDENDAEFQKMMVELEAEDSNGINRESRIIIINEEGDDGENNHQKNQMKVEIIVKTCNIVELDKSDKKSLNPQVRSGFNENLKIDQVDFYPNPNNGRFNLSFHLSNQADTEISIFSMDGKKVYEENLKDFTGGYKQEIDISKNANGIYYIRVNQGKNAWFKKMILE